MVTIKQKQIARQEATNIVREYLDSQDEDELKNNIYDAIMEALKYSSIKAVVSFNKRQKCTKITKNKFND